MTPVSERWEALYDRVAPPAYRLARAITADPAAAEDVVQEAFVRVLRRRDALRERGALDAYVTRAVRNLAYNHLRRRRSAGAARAELERRADRATAPPDPARGEEVARAEQALGALPPAQREVVHLRAHEGLAFPEVAARTGVPLGTVHSRYRAAIIKLRDALADGGTP